MLFIFIWLAYAYVIGDNMNKSFTDLLEFYYVRSFDASIILNHSPLVRERTCLLQRYTLTNKQTNKSDHWSESLCR
jgi:hypothetical protein